MNITDLEPAEYNAYYDRYIRKLPPTLALREGFSQGLENTVSFFKAIPEEKLDFKYAENPS